MTQQLSRHTIYIAKPRSAERGSLPSLLRLSRRRLPELRPQPKLWPAPFSLGVLRLGWQR